MEIGWYLRFSRQDVIEALVRKDVLPGVEDAVFIATGWDLELFENNDYLKAVMTRQVKRGKN
ncbi:MAG: hypothetical protein SVS15_11285 [Thermodesulfobacteriota bacterium]|nr:hypothetical protein [Thermodesulfobacteriota bacterium]